jgi:hypothetical protein
MKMELFWGNGISSVLYDTKKGKLLIYGDAQAREDLHNQYGGKVYYTSRSERSGKGYIENFEALIILGYYRIEGGIQPEWKYLTSEVQVSVGLHNQFERDNSLPIVFLNKRTNVIVFGEKISDWKLAQDRENAKEIEIPWYNGNLTLQKRIIFFKNPYRFRGIDIRAFLDFSFPKKEAEAAKEKSIRVIHHPSLEIWQYRNSDLYFHINQYEYIDKIWESEKDMLENLPNYWKTDDGKFFWRRKGLHPEIEIYYQRGPERYNKFLGDEIFNYFDSFSLIWWEKEKEKIKKEISMKVLRRIRRQFVHQGRVIREFGNQLRKHSPSLKITKRLASPYVCQEGLEAFMKEFELPSEMTLQEILNHPKWEKMALNHHFREVLLGIIEKKEKERIYFIEKWEERRDIL